MSAIASFGALVGTTDFNAAFDAIGNAAFNVLDNQAHDIGISHWTMFREKVEVLNRKYNTAFNETLPETAKPSLEAWQYRRQTEGN